MGCVVLIYGIAFFSFFCTQVSDLDFEVEFIA